MCPIHIRLVNDWDMFPQFKVPDQNDIRNKMDLQGMKDDDDELNLCQKCYHLEVYAVLKLFLLS